jgi:hypothetical protein
MRRLTLRTITTECWRLRSLVLAGTLGVTSAAWLTARRPESAALAQMIRTGKLVAQVNNVPSHNRHYRASLRPELTAAGQIADWRVLIETPDGKVPASPTVVMQSWMPEAPSVVGDQPTAFYLGDGVFRVDGLRFDRAGWWNVSVTISNVGVTDSLAFNLIVP